MLPDTTPIIIGVADLKNRSSKPEDAIEPLELMLQAIAAAIKDTSLSSNAQQQLKTDIDNVSVVNTWTWPYVDLPGLIEQRLGAKASYKVLSHHGGDSPAKLVDEAARKMARGESKVAIVTGGEALASLGACMAAGKPPKHWTPPDPDRKPMSPSDISRYPKSIGTTHSLGLPIHVYPLYENAFRAHHHQSLSSNHATSSALYAAFARTAAANPISWNHGKPPKTSDEIGTVGSKNRMICFPYPLLMNAFNNVNLAAAVVLTTVAHARKLGVPKEKWVFPLGGAGTSESVDFWMRPKFHESHAIGRSLDKGLEVAGLRREEVDVWDFYSCFPIVPKLACSHLGLDVLSPEKSITLLGGLTSFGGAGNNYSMHAITEMTRQLRDGKVKTGVVLANGGTVTYQHVLCLGGAPRKNGSSYPTSSPLSELVDDIPVPRITEKADGEAVIETYTVEFARDGNPFRGYVVGKLGDGSRFVANHGDEKTLKELCSWEREQVGRKGWVASHSDGRNLFKFGEEGRL